MGINGLSSPGLSLAITALAISLCRFCLQKGTGKPTHTSHSISIEPETLLVWAEHLT